LCGTERDEHEREETERLTVEEFPEPFRNLDSVSREQTLIQDDEGE